MLLCFCYLENGKCLKINLNGVHNASTMEDNVEYLWLVFCDHASFSLKGGLKYLKDLLWVTARPWLFRDKNCVCGDVTNS